MEVGCFREKQTFKPIAASALPLFSKVPEQCEGCEHTLDEKKLVENLLVCPLCSYHHRLSGQQRIATLVDEGSFIEIDRDFAGKNPINLEGYEAKLQDSQIKAEISEAVVTGQARISGHSCVIAVMDFAFLGGSMGIVVGEKVTRSILRGADQNIPVVLITASGGARMQEGIFSLMQMAKTSHAIALLEELHIPLIVILTNPTMGGVTASFAMLGDIALAEKGARIGFSGPRVIEGTIKEKLPSSFQSAEFQEEHGFIDRVIDRRCLHETLTFLLHTHAR